MLAPYCYLVLNPVHRMLGLRPAKVAFGASHTGNPSQEVLAVTFSTAILVPLCSSLVACGQPICRMLLAGRVEWGFGVRGRSPAAGRGQQSRGKEHARQYDFIHL